MTGDLDEDLLRPVARDQEVRNRIIELGLGGFPEADAVAQEVDRENTDWLRGVVESQGWPRSSRLSWRQRRVVAGSARGSDPA